MVSKLEDASHAERSHVVAGLTLPSSRVETAAAFRDRHRLLAGIAVVQAAVGTMDVPAELGARRIP